MRIWVRSQHCAKKKVTIEKIAARQQGVMPQWVSSLKTLLSFYIYIDIRKFPSDPKPIDFIQVKFDVETKSSSQADVTVEVVKQLKSPT